MRIVVPYSKEVLDEVVYLYQNTFFPIQYIFVFLALFIIFHLYKKGEKSNIFISIILTSFWLWCGLVYYLNYYIKLNWFSFYLGILFILQAIIIFYFGIIKKELDFKKTNLIVIASFFIVLVFPIIQLLANVDYFQRFTIGLIPLSTICFTLILFSTVKSTNIIYIGIIPSLYTFFNLYWNYLLEDYFRLFLSIFTIFFIFSLMKNKITQ